MVIFYSCLTSLSRVIFYIYAILRPLSLLKATPPQKGKSPPYMMMTAGLSGCAAGLFSFQSALKPQGFIKSIQLFILETISRAYALMFEISVSDGMKFTHWPSPINLNFNCSRRLLIIGTASPLQP